MCTHWQFPCLQGYWSESNNKKNHTVQRHLCGSAYVHHLKMMRLLFLSLLLLLPAASAFSDDTEGSASFESDDEDMATVKTHGRVLGSGNMGQSTGSTEDSNGDQVLVIAIVAVVAVLVLTIVIVAVACVRRRKLNQEQGIYTVPTEQGHKIAI